MKRTEQVQRTRKNSGASPRAKASSSSEILQPSQILQITQDAIFLWSNPGGIQSWNQGAANLYGYTEKEALGRKSHDLLQTRFPSPWSDIDKQLRTTGLWEGELRHRNREGKELVVSSRFQVISKSDSRLVVLESTRDITRQKANEEKLLRRLREQAGAARFNLAALRATSVQSICDAATDLLAREMDTDFSSVFELSADGKTLLLRSGAGWRAGHVGVARIHAGEGTPSGRALHLNQPIVIIDAPNDKRLNLPPFMVEHGVTSSIAVVIQGHEKPFGGLSVHTRELRAFDANDVHFLESIGNTLATAISRIQFENDLRDTAARLRGVVDTAVDGIITINEKGIVETFNPAAEKIFAYSVEEVVGNNVSMLMPEPYHSEHDGYLERYRRTGERRIIGIGREVRGRRRDGTEFPLDLAVSATKLGDRRIFTGLVRDITARKRLEQEILEVTDHEQRRIGHDLHDDLCQRLAGIRFSCDALKKTIARAGSDGITERLEKIGADLSEAIDRTRMLARGMAPVALETNGLVSALQELTRGLSTLFKVKCEFRGSETIAVKDPIAATHLYRITQEAINNALKHARPSKIIVSLEKAGNNTLLRIEDNGRGFTPQEAQQSGEGMGLQTIAYRAGMIDAGLQVTSALGRGTKIVCTFRSNL